MVISVHTPPVETRGEGPTPYPPPRPAPVPGAGFRFFQANVLKRASLGQFVEAESCRLTVGACQPVPLKAV